jgi:hypothetical protein
MLKIGKFEYTIFEYQCKILRTKRKIEIVQALLNREKSYNIDEIEDQLDKEYQEYTDKLLEKQKEIERARQKNSNYGRLLTDEESSELRKLYTLIVKKLHPDINPDTTEDQHSQFVDAVNAYKNADLSELRIIYLLLEKTSVTETVSSMDKLQTKKELLFNEKAYLLNEIQKIKETFPYTVKNLLQDDEKLQHKIGELSNLLTECQEQYKTQKSRLEVIQNMSELIRIDETNIISVLNSARSGLDIGKPFSRQIYLVSASIAGSYYVDDIHDLLDEMKTGAKLRFIREPDNQYDELAILVKDQNNNKLGYVPRKKNPILARLMDAGKLIYGTIKTINNDDSYINIEMEIFMDD